MGLNFPNTRALESLTPRECEILGLIGQGLSIPEIAERLYRSQKTIETHRLSLGRKLNANNRVELARIAIQFGLAPLESQQRKATYGTPSHRDQLTEKSNAWHALRNIEAAVADAAGPRYFRKLLSSLTEQLHVRTAVIGEIIPSGEDLYQASVIRIHTSLNSGPLADPQNVQLKNSLFSELIDQKDVRLENDLAQRFPHCVLLKHVDFQCQYFLATRLDDIHGKPIGMLGLIHEHPLSPSLEPEHILTFCASRAAVELERFSMEEKLREASEKLEEKVHQRTAELEDAFSKLHDGVERQRRTQARLHDSEQQYLALVETMNEGLATLDPDGKLMFVNQQFAHMCRRTKEQLVGHYCTEFLPPEEARRFRELYKQRVANELNQYDLRVNRPDGSQFTMHIVTRSLFDDQGNYIGSLGVINEVD